MDSLTIITIAIVAAAIIWVACVRHGLKNAHALEHQDKNFMENGDVYHEQ